MSSISLSDLLKFFKNFRNLFVPRSSYKTAGPAASELFLSHVNNKSHDQDEIFNLEKEIINNLLQDKEFDTVKKSNNWKQVVGHVILFSFVSSNDQSSHILLQEVKDLILNKNSKVSFILYHEEDEEVLSSFLSSFQEISSSSSKLINYNGNNFKLMVFYSKSQFKVRPEPSPFSLAFNKQPAVSTLNQFRFIWSRLTPPPGCPEYKQEDLQHYKTRVLFRIASHSLLDGSKLSMSQWDSIISDILNRGGDDYDIYSEIRYRVIGKTLRDEFEILLGLKEDDQVKVSQEEDEDKRSDSLVRMSFNAMPYKFKSNPRNVNSNYTYLDYGCAEGSITEPLGKMLGVGKILGADVRSIVSNNFKFYLLPSENEDEITIPSSILPDIPSNSVNIITSAMVFHHVTHAESALIELHRILNKTNGCFLIREHDCETPGCGAFLDITHGLFSLSWSVPIEWPEFLTEYKACYRSREEWVELLARCGFRLEPNMNEAQQKSYNGCKYSKFNPEKNTFINVVRAFYATFYPIPNFQFPKLISSNIEVYNKINLPFFKLTSTQLHQFSGNSTTGSSNDNRDSKEIINRPIQIFESSKYPGKFYLYEPTSKKARWI